MQIKLIRNNKLTEGQLFINDKYFCDTLEDKWRDLKNQCKIPNETCIPAGRYRIVWDMSHRFARKMLHVLNVPRFDGIRIHAGNKRNDTSGCILVGKRSEECVLINSRQTTQELEDTVLIVITQGEEVWLEIIDPE